jgi:hypothetical protein
MAFATPLLRGSSFCDMGRLKGSVPLGEAWKRPPYCAQSNPQPINPTAPTLPNRPHMTRAPLCQLDPIAAMHPTSPTPNNPGNAECFAPRVKPIARPRMAIHRQRQVEITSAAAGAVMPSMRASERSVIATGACAMRVGSSAIKASAPAAHAKPAARQTRRPKAKSKKPWNAHMLARVRACAAAALLS